MAGLRGLPKLARLGLAGCSGIGNGALGSVAALPSLEELNLEWCTVGDKGAPHSLPPQPLFGEYWATPIVTCLSFWLLVWLP